MTQRAVQPEGEMSECTTCRAPIRKGAKKCTECESYQDWRRWAAIGDTSLALIIAALSVLTVLVPVASRALANHEEDIQISILEVEPQLGVVRFLASNLGDRAGGIRSADLVVPGRDATPWTLDLLYRDTLVLAEQSRELRGASALSLPSMSAKGKSTECELVVRIVRFSGEERVVRKRFSAVIGDRTGLPPRLLAVSKLELCGNTLGEGNRWVPLPPRTAPTAPLWVVWTVKPEVSCRVERVEISGLSQETLYIGTLDGTWVETIDLVAGKPMELAVQVADEEQCRALLDHRDSLALRHVCAGLDEPTTLVERKPKAGGAP